MWRTHPPTTVLVDMGDIPQNKKKQKTTSNSTAKIRKSANYILLKQTCHCLLFRSVLVVMTLGSSKGRPVFHFVISRRPDKSDTNELICGLAFAVCRLVPLFTRRIKTSLRRRITSIATRGLLPRPAAKTLPGIRTLEEPGRTDFTGDDIGEVWTEHLSVGHRFSRQSDVPTSCVSLSADRPCARQQHASSVFFVFYISYIGGLKIVLF